MEIIYMWSKIEEVDRTSLSLSSSSCIKHVSICQKRNCEKKKAPGATGLMHKKRKKSEEIFRK